MNPWMRVFAVSCFAVFLVFQNCSDFEALQGGEIYPFHQKPNYFYDLQLSNIETLPGNDDVYTFDFAIADAEDPLAELDFTLNFYSPDMPAGANELPKLCPEAKGLSNDGKVHFRYRCRSLLPQVDILIAIQVSGADREPEMIQLRIASVQTAKQENQLPRTAKIDTQ